MDKGGEGLNASLTLKTTVFGMWIFARGSRLQGPLMDPLVNMELQDQVSFKNEEEVKIRKRMKRRARCRMGEKEE